MVIPSQSLSVQQFSTGNWSIAKQPLGSSSTRNIIHLGISRIVNNITTYCEFFRTGISNSRIRNTFPTPIAIYQVTVSHPDIFELTNFNGNGSQTLPAGGELDLFEIKVRKREELCNPKSNIHLILKSNVTNLSLPITCFDGKLQVVRHGF